MDFMIGCNYWASNAGTEMWNNWSEEAVKDDLRILSSHGVKYMRVFPNWRDFQPVEALMTGMGDVVEFRLKGGKMPENEYFIDEVMLERFLRFCDICEEYNIKLIVGIVTGWMSGGLFVPPIVGNRNVYSDSLALLLQQKFIKGLVSNSKDKKAIYAWDLGNECNCMHVAKDRYEAANWTGIIANTIRANDSKRPIVSGMHSIDVADKDVKWTIEDQAEFCDILTTHPYPIFVEYAYKDKMTSFRTLMHATCETKYYSDIGKKPALVEEIGTLGPMFCSDEAAADFLHLNILSNYINGAKGVMWWCANEQVELTTFPYTHNNTETELGMIYKNREPKPVLKEMKKLEKIISDFDFELPPAQTDAVCVITQQQKHWGAAYMTYCLAKQAGMNIEFCYGNNDIPDSDVYMIPSVCGYKVMRRDRYYKILKRVKEGATLYVSSDSGRFPEFKETFGIKVTDSGLFDENVTVDLDGEAIGFSRTTRFELIPEGAEVIAYDSEGLPAVTVNRYGKGKVYYVNFPAETMLLDKNNAFDRNVHKIYAKIFENKITSHEVVSDNQFVGVTIHKNKDEIYCAAVNYSSQKQEPEFKLKPGFEPDGICYGNISVIKPFDAVIFKLKRK